MVVEKHVDILTDQQIQEQYGNNVFYIQNKQYFSELVRLYKLYGDKCIFILKYSYYQIYQWIDNMFETVQFTYTLTIDDKYKLILNNITHLPNCRCKLKI